MSSNTRTQLAEAGSTPDSAGPDAPTLNQVGIVCLRSTTLVVM